MIDLWASSTMPGWQVFPSPSSAAPLPGFFSEQCPFGLDPFGHVDDEGPPGQKLAGLASPSWLVLLLLPVLAVLLLLVLFGVLLQLLLLLLPPGGLQGGAGGQSGSSPLPQPEPLLVLWWLLPQLAVQHLLLPLPVLAQQLEEGLSQLLEV